MRVSRRLEAVQSPVIPVVGDLIRATPGCVSLGQGVVGYPPPPQAMRRAAAFAGGADHAYKPVGGFPELLEMIAAKHRAENGFDPLKPGRALMVTAGGNMAFVNALLAVADPGDEVILPTPYYFNHEMAVTIANCTPVLVPVDDGYQLRPAALRAAITPRTRAIVTVSPNNPTGAVYPESTLREVNGICRDAGIYHVADEAYEHFTWDGATHFSPAAIAGSEGHTISLHSLSKSHGFAAWRIGWMVMPAHLLPAVRKVQDTILICPPVVSQHAAIGAMEAGRAYCRGRLAEMAGVRARVLEELAGLGGVASVPRADGAFYFLVDVHTKLRAMTVVERLIREHGVGVLPGDPFGIGSCVLRIAYGALSRETAGEGIGRLVRGLKAIVR
jgi:aspartate/methionine/tyrosine aminotransferase